MKDDRDRLCGIGAGELEVSSRQPQQFGGLPSSGLAKNQERSTAGFERLSEGLILWPVVHRRFNEVVPTAFDGVWLFDGVDFQGLGREGAPEHGVDPEALDLAREDQQIPSVPPRPC
ncbi:MAG: hypothetical protein AAFY88_17775 [Acidobacteriota bacterium]